MKIITCASFYGSGSSALTDLVSEYSNVKDLSNYEFRFLHDIDGVSDLEFHLCECHNRHNSGHALKRFKKLAKFNSGNFLNKRYENFFHNQYYSLTSKYVSDLTDFSYNGWWFYDLYDKGSFKYYFLIIINKILKKITNGNKSILSKEMTLCSHPSVDKFLNITRKYVSELLAVANDNNSDYLEVDQLVPSQNINRILRYIPDDIFVFIVDRDPRDIYISNKLFFKSHVCPMDVDSFCDWFIYTRESGCTEVLPDNVINLRFEDLIYKYNDTVKKIELKTGLKSNNHVKKYSKLNPKRSINNTQLWKKYDLGNDIAVIEERLKKYLYPFDDVIDNEIKGIETNDKKVF